MTISRGLDGIQQLCVELATVIHANFHVAPYLGPERGRLSLYEEFFQHHHSTVKAKAIELAVNFRIFDEGGDQSPAYLELKREVEEGLKPGAFLSPHPGPLSLRECANKIIHARDFRFLTAHYQTTDARTGEVFSLKAKDSTIQVVGNRAGRPWECRIDLLAYSEALHQLIHRWVSGDFRRVEVEPAATPLPRTS